MGRGVFLKSVSFSPIPSHVASRGPFTKQANFGDLCVPRARAMLFAGLRAERSGGVESRRNVIIGFHFVLMPGTHHDCRLAESPVGVASRQPGRGPARDRDAVYRARKRRQRHEPGIWATPRENGAKNRGFDRAGNTENGRTNPPRMRWREGPNLFHILRFNQKYKTNWRLTTWTDCGKRTRARSTAPRDHAGRRERSWNGFAGVGRSRIAHTTCATSHWARMELGEDGSRIREGSGIHVMP